MHRNEKVECQQCYYWETMRHLSCLHLNTLCSIMSSIVHYLPFLLFSIRLMFNNRSLHTSLQTFSFANVQFHKKINIIQRSRLLDRCKKRYRRKNTGFWINRLDVKWSYHWFFAKNALCKIDRYFDHSPPSHSLSLTAFLDECLPRTSSFVTDIWIHKAAMLSPWIVYAANIPWICIWIGIHQPIFLCLMILLGVARNERTSGRISRSGSLDCLWTWSVDGRYDRIRWPDRLRYRWLLLCISLLEDMLTAKTDIAIAFISDNNLRYDIISFPSVINSG